MRRLEGGVRPGPLSRLPHEFLLAFSCRGRWFCPSCHAKKVVQFGELLRENIIFPRNPFSTAKLRYTPESGMVIYRSKMTHGKNRKNFALFSAEEFSAAITQHISDKSFQLLRYHGWYSKRMRGERNKTARAAEALAKPDNRIEIIDVTGYQPRRIPPPVWRECIKKIWEVDPLRCPRCKGEMKIISFITEASVIRAILEHLHLWWEIPRPRSPPICPEPEPQEVKRHYLEPADDCRPVYEEPFITYD